MMLRIQTRREGYLRLFPFDRFKTQIQAGKPVMGMNRDQLIACLSRWDIGYDYKTVGPENFLVDVVYEKQALLPPVPKTPTPRRPDPPKRNPPFPVD